MCLIISKNAGNRLPKKGWFRCAEVNNPDGIGLAWSDGQGTVNIKKGFKTIDDFIDFFYKTVTKEMSCIVHFRWATHGSTGPGNCHPFPVVNDRAELLKIDTSCGLAMAHNGVFAEYGYDAKETLSDTQRFILDILATKVVKNNLRDITIQKLIAEKVGPGNKLAFLYGDGEIVLIGDFHSHKGSQFSNDGYKERKRYIYSGYSSFGHESPKGKKYNSYGYDLADRWRRGYDYAEEYDDLAPLLEDKRSRVCAKCFGHDIGDIYSSDYRCYCYTCKAFGDTIAEPESEAIKSFDVEPCEMCEVTHYIETMIETRTHEGKKFYICGECKNQILSSKV